MFQKSLIVFVSLIILCVFLASPKVASAHVLETDGPIGAVLHIDPDDDPIVGQDAHFYFDFKAKGTSFNLNNCSCNFEILENNNQINSQSLTSSGQDTTSAHVTFNFPKKGIYQLLVTGTSTNSSFPDFKLSYDLRVSRESAENKESTNFFGKYINIFILVTIAIVFLAFVFFGNRKPKGPQEKPKLNIWLLLVLATFLLHQFTFYQIFFNHHQQVSSADYHQEHPCCSVTQLKLSELFSLGQPTVLEFNTVNEIGPSYSFALVFQNNSRSPPINI